MVFVLNNPDNDESSFVLNKLDGVSFVLNRLVDDGFPFVLNRLVDGGFTFVSNRLVDDELLLILEDDVVSWFLSDWFIWAFGGSVVGDATIVGVAFFGFDSDIKGVNLLLVSENFTVGEVLLFNVKVATMGGAFDDDDDATVGGTLDDDATVGGAFGDEIATVGGALDVAVTVGGTLDDDVATVGGVLGVVTVGGILNGNRWCDEVFFWWIGWFPFMDGALIGSIGDEVLCSGHCLYSLCGFELPLLPI